MLEVTDLTKSYGATRILDGISVDIKPGTTTVILGRSGSGKSTLLRCMGLLETPDSGQLRLDGELILNASAGDRKRSPREKELARHRSELGMVFQRFNLFPHMTAAENLMLGLREVRGFDKSTARSIALEHLSEVGLHKLVDRYPTELSGGQQQRVAIARALSMKPKVMLFDEPTSALDAELVKDVLGVMQKLASNGMTMAVVTHELRFARDVGSEVLFIDGGRVVECGTPDKMFDDPETEATRTFLSAIR